MISQLVRPSNWKKFCLRYIPFLSHKVQNEVRKFEKEFTENNLKHFKNPIF